MPRAAHPITPLGENLWMPGLDVAPLPENDVGFYLHLLLS